MDLTELRRMVDELEQETLEAQAVTADVNEKGTAAEAVAADERLEKKQTVLAHLRAALAAG